jgi:DNA-binding response OmpR family regulator
MRILLAEADRKLSLFLQRLFLAKDHVIRACQSGTEAMDLSASDTYELLILGGKLPDIGSLEVCRRLRRSGNGIAILMLTDTNSPAVRVLGLKAGADDVCSKTSDVAEMLARVNALRRRASGELYQQRIGALIIDRAHQQVFVQGKPLDLTRREFALLAALAIRPNEPVARPVLLFEVWRLRFDPDSNVIEVLVNKLREKMGDHAWMIETVRSRGYRLLTAKSR